MLSEVEVQSKGLFLAQKDAIPIPIANSPVQRVASKKKAPQHEMLQLLIIN